MVKVFVIQSFSPDRYMVYEQIREAVRSASADAEIFRADELVATGLIVEGVYEAIETADLIICDISGKNPNIHYELGYAHGLRKPVLLISDAESLKETPFDVRGTRILIYENRLSKLSEFSHNLRPLISAAFEDPSAFSYLPTTQSHLNKVFISYSHKDVEFLNRLRVHLRPLEKEGLIDIWDDTKLGAGTLWKKEIEEALDLARVAIIMISADFLASDFILDNELPKLLANAEKKGIQIIPVILKPCRFVRDKNLSRFQTIHGTRSPLISLPESEQEQIYDEIAQAVENSLIRKIGTD